MSEATLTGRQLLERAARDLLDPQGRELAAAVQWWSLPGLPESWPVAVMGPGANTTATATAPEPVLLLHGFDSSCLEFRRLAPLLAARTTLLVPDLYGFGFSPRPSDGDVAPAAVLQHLERLLEVAGQRLAVQRFGVIGASMGGSVAVELARRCPERISRLLLLAPAGLTGRPMPLPAGLDALGVWFLGRPGVRQGLCRSAFADPDACVGPAELEIASLHLATPGWGRALARFARSGGFAGCGEPLPQQPLQVLWGANDRILRPPQKRAALALLGERVRELERCGHLPHIDQPVQAAQAWFDLCQQPA